MRTSSAAWLGLLVGILWVLTPTPARTSPLLELLGAPSSAASLDARLTGVGPEACYFNPTLLLYAREGLDVGFFVLGTSASIDLEPRPADADVPSAVYQSRVQNQDGTTSVLDVRPLPTADLEPRQGDADGGEPGIRSYVVLGALGHLVEGRVSMGFYAVVPTHAFQAQRAFFSDEREQYGTNSLHFELLGDRAENAVVSAGFGMKITDSLNVGGGAAFTFHSNARTPAFVPDSSDQRTILLNSDVSVDAIFAPHMAITWRPIERLELVATLHAPTSAEITGRNELKLWNYRYENGERSLLQTYEFVHTYMPARASLGLLWLSEGVRDEGWSAGLLGSWTDWSTYRDRHGETPADPFHDTFDVLISLRKAYTTGGLHLSARYTPSPIPGQPGRTSYVDNDRLALALGADGGVEIFGLPVRWALQLQAQRLLPRSEKKSADASDPVRDEVPDSAVDLLSGEPIEGASGLQTNNPGYPGYKSGGWLFGAGVAMRLPF